MGRKTKYTRLDWLDIPHTTPEGLDISKSDSELSEGQIESLSGRLSLSNTDLASPPTAITEAHSPVNDSHVTSTVEPSGYVTKRDLYGLQSSRPLSLLPHESKGPRPSFSNASLYKTTPMSQQDGQPRSRGPSRHLVNEPIVGKVYFLADASNFPGSIIHRQKQQNGFFRHPVLVTTVDRDIAFFYALTKVPPNAIRDLEMCLLLGSTTTDQDDRTLRLDEGSSAMQTETWANLEQRYYIEWRNLFEWAVDVRINPDNMWKLAKRIYELEAEQNRYIYKPLPQNMSILRPGTVVMLCNDANSSTLGAPVLIMENQYPRFRFLRIKLFSENMHFNPEAKRKHAQPRHMCLEVTKNPKTGHENTPVMLLEPNSPEMREPSYVEVFPTTRLGSLELCKTWSWPPVVIRRDSMQVLRQYMARDGGSTGANPISSQLFSTASSHPPTPYATSSTYPMSWLHNGTFYKPLGAMLPHPLPFRPGGQHTSSMHTPPGPYQAAPNGYKVSGHVSHDAAQFPHPTSQAGVYDNSKQAQLKP